MKKASFRKISKEISQMKTNGYDESTIKAVLNSKYSESDIESVYKEVIKDEREKNAEHQKQREIKTTAEIEQKVLNICEQEKSKKKLFLLEPIVAFCSLDLLFVFIILPILLFKSLKLESYQQLYLEIQSNTIQTWFFIIYFTVSFFLKVFISPWDKTSYSHLMPNAKKNFLSIYRSEMRGDVLKNFLIGCLSVVCLQFVLSIFLPHYKEPVSLLPSSVLLFESLIIQFYLLTFRDIPFSFVRIAAIALLIFFYPFDFKVYKILKKISFIIALVFLGLLVFVFPTVLLFLIVPIIYLAIINRINYFDRLVYLRNILTFHSVKKSLLWIICFAVPIGLFFTWQLGFFETNTIQETEKEPAILGELNVRTYPTGASVYLNDKYQGISEITISEIKEPYNIIKVVKDGHEDTTRSVSFEEGAYEDKSVFIILEKLENKEAVIPSQEKFEAQRIELTSLYTAKENGERTTRFKDGDGGLYVLFTFAYWFEKHSIGFELFAPDDQLFSRFSFEYAAQENGLLKEGRGYSFSDEGKKIWDEMKKTPGKWEIKLHLDGKFVESISFYVDNETLLSPEVVLVKKGDFKMGDATGKLPDNVQPIHHVSLTYDYYIGKHEVTFEEYDYYCAEIGKEYPSDENFGRKTQPVINIDWYDAIDYCNWLSERNNLPKAYDEKGNLLDEKGEITLDVSNVRGYRLPTEAEWEYAARGGHLMNKDYLFSGSNNLQEVGWSIENTFSYPKPRRIGQKKENQLALYDMSGNVWEMCQDFWNEGYYQTSPKDNPLNTKKSVKRVIRGGSWVSPETHCRVAFRNGFESGNNSIGFRIAKTNDDMP